MTTPKEALEQAVSFARQVACIEGVRRAPEMKTIAEQYQAIFEHALASLQGEDAVERVARIMDLVEALLQADCEFEQATPGNDQPAYENLKAARAELEGSLTTLATGLVPDEAASPRTILSSDCVDPDIEQAIRADEREKCAKIAEDNERQDEWPLHGSEMQAPSRRMQSAIAAAIRSNGRGA